MWVSWRPPENTPHSFPAASECRASEAQRRGSPICVGPGWSCVGSPLYGAKPRRVWAVMIVSCAPLCAGTVSPSCCRCFPPDGCCFSKDCLTLGGKREASPHSPLHPAHRSKCDMRSEPSSKDEAKVQDFYLKLHLSSTPSPSCPASLKPSRSQGHRCSAQALLLPT